MHVFLKIIFFTLLTSNIAFSQIMIRGFNYRPTGEFGSVMKPLFSAEIGYQQPFEDERFRGGFLLTFLQMKPRMNIFPVYGIIGKTVFPGEQSFQKYNLGLLLADMDFAFVNKEKYTMYTGLGLMMGGANVEYEYYLQSAVYESYSGGGFIMGFRFRLGAEYIINDYIALNLNANRIVFWLEEPAARGWANDYGIGMRYSFD